MRKDTPATHPMKITLLPTAFDHCIRYLVFARVATAGRIVYIANFDCPIRTGIFVIFIMHRTVETFEVEPITPIIKMHCVVAFLHVFNLTFTLVKYRYFTCTLRCRHHILGVCRRFEILCVQHRFEK